MTGLVCLAAVTWVVTEKLKITSKQRTISQISRGWDMLWTLIDLRLDHRVTTAQCLLVVGITLRSLAPLTWNKSKKRLCLVVKVEKSSPINE